MKFRICTAACGYEMEPLISAFGFKGSALTKLWQTSVRLETEKHIGQGLGVQSVLWSDAAVYHALGEEAGNRVMFRVTQHAVSLCEGMEVEHPFSWIDAIFPEVYAFAKKETGMEHLRRTFVLNALVPVDFAMWQLWCRENQKTSFDEISLFSGNRQNILLNIPLITYSTSVEEVQNIVRNGAALLKIKIGSDPFQNNDSDAMLTWDKNRLLEIHRAVMHIEMPYTDTGHVMYYLDANGRYDTKERLMSLLRFAKEQGILDRILLLEEPFDEQNKTDVHDVPVCVVADESAHSVEDVEERFRLGYNALALKPIAKTLSMSIRMAEFAQKHGMHCFCADLTVNPVMVSWNQCVASRLKRIPHMLVGVLESNGAQNYMNWKTMQSYHPMSHMSFTQCKNSVFYMDEAFYKTDGGIFEISEHYCRLTQRKEE